MNEPRLSRQQVRREVLETYKEVLLGIPVVLKDAVVREIDEAGEETITIPKMDGLVAAVAVTRCLMPRKLAGREIRFLRKALGLQAKELAEALDLTPETISRWENDAQAIGDNFEKLLRHYVCAKLHTRAPAIDFDPEMIATLRVVPAGPVEDVQPLVFELVKLKRDGTKTREWDSALPEAA
jgi:transcriptional regulator with XRE-family HTH domain